MVKSGKMHIMFGKNLRFLYFENSAYVSKECYNLMFIAKIEVGNLFDAQCKSYLTHAWYKTKLASAD